MPRNLGGVQSRPLNRDSLVGSFFDPRNRVSHPPQEFYNLPLRRVRLGFREIKGISKKLITAVVQTRPFHSLGDLADRLRPYSINKRDLILLGSANALDSIGTSRRRAIWDIQALPISFGFVNTPLR